MAIQEPDLLVAPAGGQAPIILETPVERWRLRGLSGELELWLPLTFLIVLVLACFVWPEIYKIPNPVKGNLATPDLPPLSAHHILGTDQLGNDVMSRILYGGRVSLEVGVGATVIGTVIGGAFGAFAAFKGGLIETVIMRAMEILLSFPALVLVIIVAAFLGPSELHVIWAVSFIAIPSHARVARANTLKVKEQVFITASRLSGVTDGRILIRHVAPHILPPLMTVGLLGVGTVIIVEASLSFLGFGVPPPGPSWGNMIALGQQNLTSAPDLVIVPSIFLFATVLALNLVGDALRVRWGTE